LVSVLPGIEPVVVDRPGVGAVYRSLRRSLYSSVQL